MSVHNRLLLNRLTVGGYVDAEVMLLVDRQRPGRISRLIERLGGKVERVEPAIGYVRAQVPLSALSEVTSDPTVDAYQLSSLASGSLHHDGPPQSSATLRRSFEASPAVRETSSASDELPALSPTLARQSGYTADDDAGVGRWLETHPTFDGRGVTIAFLESAEVEFSHPALRTATTLDGRDVPKVAGILNTLGPDDSDRTLVDLSTEIHAVRAWHAVGGRTYILPRPGAYRFGLFLLPAGGNLVEQFAVLRDEATGQVWVDTDGDADFRNEVPVADVNTAFDPQTLDVSHPRRAELAFVVAAGRQPNQLHLYVARDGHATMAVSVAAGSRTVDGLAHGVAPGASVLLVRYIPNVPASTRLRAIIEGYLDVARRPDIDILYASTGLGTVPDTTTRHFVGIFLGRLIETYRKPVFDGAGNSPHHLHSIRAASDAFSVGGAIGPATFRALYGGGALDGMAVHPTSAAGPSLDGALKPDFIAPVNLIAANVWKDQVSTPVPKNAPAARIPAGYQVSCCTSASSPYAAGVAALLISAAKQAGVHYSAESLGRALRFSARFIPDWPAHQQGNGVLNIQAAWEELQRPAETHEIRAAADNRHALTAYSPSGHEGVGLFEQAGWRAGMTGERVLRLRRESGPSDPVTYRLSWTGNNGTFATDQTVTLPLRESVALPVSVTVSTPGAHSAILNLHDTTTNAIAFRTLATIVAAEEFDDAMHTVRISGRLPLLRTAEHFVTIPAGTAAVRIELNVIRGAVTASVIPSHGAYRGYYTHVLPGMNRTFPQGRHSVVLPWPAAGTWTISVNNTSTVNETDPSLVSADDAVYTISIERFGASLAPAADDEDGSIFEVTNRGARLREPAIDTSIGTLQTRDAELPPTGLASQIEIDVPPDASTLLLQVRAREDATPLDLHLYDCTSGECFSWDFTMGAAPKQTMVVGRPAAGRWVAAVSSVPFPPDGGRFELQAIITNGVKRHAIVGPLGPGDMTQVPRPDAGAMEPPAEPGLSPIVLYELVDAWAEEDAAAHPWENREGVPSLSHRSVAVGTAVVRLD